MNNQAFFKNIQSKVQFEETEFELFESFFETIDIKKKHILIEEGKRNDKLYFIKKGLLYSYKTLENGNTQVIQFASENHWISDLSSFFNSTMALFTIQALEDCELLCLEKEKFDQACAKIPKIERLFRLTFQGAYANTLQRLSDIYSEDAQSKYQEFINKYPSLIQRVPQYLIASYLGILPSSLSRIRNKKITK